VDEGKRIDEIPGWFHGARLNFAENLLSFKDDQKTALVFANEHGVQRHVSFGELRGETAALAQAMRNKMGISKGDVVGIWAPNMPESVAWTLAAASIGAIVTAVSPDFGHQSVLDRFQQTKPRLLLSCNAVLYNGKVHGHWEKVAELLQECPSIEQVVWVDYMAEASNKPAGDKWIPCAEFKEEKSTPIVFEQLPFNHPLYVLYSSGTTGKPKCIVHSAGGTLLQHLKEHRLHADLTSDDSLLQYTTVGWMMWQWQLSALAMGTTLVLYDGSPFRPTDSSLLELLKELSVTAFGTSAKFLQRLEEIHLAPPEMPQLKQIFSTGSPLPASTFEYVSSHLPKVRIASITGGTDIISLFAGGNPTLPVYAGQIQCRCLGMAVHAVNTAGASVTDEPGDLVCTRPFPSMPVFFWNDPPTGPDSAYQRAYFSAQPGVWHHGDFLQIDGRTGGLLMLGRSDGTLNPAGVRFGSADLYQVVARLPRSLGIKDALAVGMRRMTDPDERVVLFLELDTGHSLSESSVSALKAAIRSELSPRHVPAFILAAPQIPYTINGKKVEVAVKRIISGLPGVSTSSLANPEALDFFRSLSFDY
jgi:acetoacetyl-CoA synthetase